MKQLLWIGSLESDEEFIKKSEKGYNLASAQVSQKNIFMGIEEVTGIGMDSINGSVLPPYPAYSDAYIKEIEWSHKLGVKNVSVGYSNKKYINRITCKNSMLKAADKWVKDVYDGEELIIFVYSMRTPTMATACKIKRLHPKAKIYLIVTDLPQFMDLGQNKMKKFLKKLDWFQIKMLQNQFDGFILYTSKMAEFLKIPDSKWILMEGLYNSEECENSIETKDKYEEKSRIIMYSGKLDFQYGIDLLINSFMKINDPKLELWLTGGGNAEDFIRRCEAVDNRIKFFGFLPSRSDVLNKQEKATLLVNMRLPSEAASAYCFPSKLFEYMSTGIPVVSFNIKGIPHEYHKHLLLIDEENEQSVIYTILRGLNMNMNIRKKFGEDAKKFILSQKNKEYQAKKIIDFIYK